MNNFVITPAKQTKAVIKNSNDVFPVRRIYCIGRNYAEHVIEMGYDHREPSIDGLGKLV